MASKKKEKEEELTAEEKKKGLPKKRNRKNAMLGGTVVLSIVIALALFLHCRISLSGLLKGDKLTDAHSVHRGCYQTGNISGVYSNYIADT